VKITKCIGNYRNLSSVVVGNRVITYSHAKIDAGSIAQRQAEINAALNVKTPCIETRDASILNQFVHCGV